MAPKFDGNNHGNLEGKNNGSGNGDGNLQGNMDDKKPTGATVVATVVAKNAGKYVAGLKARAANSMTKFGLRARALGSVATKGQTCITGKSNSKTNDKAMAKIVARGHDWTHRWEITGKSRPRRHIAWPHDIVCSRWLAHAASEVVTYAKQVTMFNRMIWWCEMIKLRAQNLVCL